MTEPLKPVIWTEVPVERQRRLIGLLSRLALRHMAPVPMTEGSTDESNNLWVLKISSVDDFVTGSRK